MSRPQPCAPLRSPLASHAESAFEPTQVYANLGYANANQDDVNLGAIQGRLGVRLGKYLGAEGEVAAGVRGEDFTSGNVTAHLKLSSEYAFYGVGFLPVSPNVDAFARVGYGRTNLSVTANNGGVASGSANSWNFGGGGQYFFTKHDGVRVDYTYYRYDGGGNANVWAVAYVRKF